MGISAAEKDMLKYAIIQLMWGFSSFTNISKSEYEMQSLKEECNYEALSLPTPACWARCWCWRVLVRCITAVNSGRCALSVQISWLVISEAGNNTKYIRGLFTPKLSLYIHFIVVCCGIMTVECSLELLNFNIDHNISRRCLSATSKFSL